MKKTLEVRKGSYVDSVSLMQVSKRVSATAGVSSALVAMATDLNLELATGMGFEPPDSIVPNEMLVCIDAESPSALEAALAELETALAASRAPGGAEFGSAPDPVTVRAAARRTDAQVALISTPGQHAFSDAVDAMDSGMHTMVFSDNVPVDQELALKDYAHRAGVLLMGPDCGTAVIGGVGLGFANVVRPGPVGIVAASGTGAQHLMSLLDGTGIGVSHCLGVGGRDLSAEVGGRSTSAALELLDADEDTELIVVVSKPPAADVAQAVREHADALGTPVLFGLLGIDQPDLTATARAVTEAVGVDWAPPSHHVGAVPQGRAGGSLRGLFVGGTLCDEAMIIAAAELGPIASNIALDPAWSVDDSMTAAGHLMIDFGDDRLTRGRPHPMIDGSIRAQRFLSEIRDESTGVVMLDVVLGLGSAAEPATDLAATIREATSLEVPVVVSVTGTRGDPQGLSRQVEALREAGAWVYLSNADAARRAVNLVHASTKES